MRAFIPCVAALLLRAGTEVLAATTCEDIRSFDLSNASLLVGQRQMTFTNGVSCPPNYFGDGGPCEFEYRMALDLLLTPEPDVRLRMVVFDEDHVRGSPQANGRSLVAYRCEHGRPSAVFSLRFEGDVGVMEAFERRLLLAVNGSTKLYEWSPTAHTYKLSPISGGEEDRPPPIAPLPVPDPSRGDGQLPRR